MIADYPMSMHMVLDILLMLVCGPLLVAGLPYRPGRRERMRLFCRFLSRHAWLGWMGGTITMWFWHIPAIHQWTMTAEHSYSYLPLVRAPALLAGGMLFGRPLVGPEAQFRIDPLSGVIYLATACVSCSIMGLLMTFAPKEVYQDMTRQDIQNRRAADVGARLRHLSHRLSAPDETMASAGTRPYLLYIN
ncbi:cytochrome c oxidase assembly protein [Puia sp. P3]|uniref:cytochrome c oxidase assembly protein n=1 Tax=Puia sp. P3 TaxID=3423952 RepID=UPI003D6706CB